jgi:hypothetical protein
MKQKIFEIFKKAIETFENLNEIEIIATFGSITKFENPNFDDLDVIIISDKKSHDRFISHLKKEFITKNFEPIVFETITKKPKKEKENQVLIHDLNYRSLSDLIEKEWKTVVDAIKLYGVILYGDKNFANKINTPKTTEKDIIRIIWDWIKKISEEKEFNLFQKHWKKIIPKYIKRYDYLELENLKEIQNLLNQKLSWNKKLEEINSLIAQI